MSCKETSVERLVRQALSLSEELSALTGHEIYCIDVLYGLAASGLTLKTDINSIMGDTK